MAIFIFLDFVCGHKDWAQRREHRYGNNASLQTFWPTDSSWFTFFWQLGLFLPPQHHYRLFRLPPIDLSVLCDYFPL